VVRPVRRQAADDGVVAVGQRDFGLERAGDRPIRRGAWGARLGLPSPACGRRVDEPSTGNPSMVTVPAKVRVETHKLNWADALMFVLESPQGLVQAGPHGVGTWPGTTSCDAQPIKELESGRYGAQPDF
jgi:hypothetical protein